MNALCFTSAALAATSSAFAAAGAVAPPFASAAAQASAAATAILLRIIFLCIRGGVFVVVFLVGPFVVFILCHDCSVFVCVRVQVLGMFR